MATNIVSALHDNSGLIGPLSQITGRMDQTTNRVAKPTYSKAVVDVGEKIIKELERNVFGFAKNNLPEVVAEVRKMTPADLRSLFQWAQSEHKKDLPKMIREHGNSRVWPIEFASSLCGNDSAYIAYSLHHFLNEIPVNPSPDRTEVEWFSALGAASAGINENNKGLIIEAYDLFIRGRNGKPLRQELKDQASLYQQRQKAGKNIDERWVQVITELNRKINSQ